VDGRATVLVWLNRRLRSPEGNFTNHPVQEEARGGKDHKIPVIEANSVCVGYHP